MNPLDAKSVFGRAAEIPDPAARAAFLDDACAGRPEARAEVETLLRALADAGSFMRSPAAGADATRQYDGDIPEGEGTIIGPYTLREQIGEGGMGLVFVAEQTHPVRRKVALKVIKPGMDTKQVVARFEAERQALALMDDPNIARVLDAGTTASGLPYFVMELVRGVPVTEYADANKFTPQQRLELFVQVCNAVQHAHQKGVIHRDLKPSNILVAPHDGVPVVKVIDFGVAKAIGQTLTEKTIYTRFAQMIGTPLYMSPEQAEVNQLDVDTRSDVYALGVVLYELLTGTTPFDGERFRKAAFDEMRRIIKEEEPPRPSTRLTSLGATLTATASKRGTDPGKLAGVIRGELDWIVMRCLEKDRTRRYDGAAALVKDVQRYLSGDSVEACPPTLGYRLKKAYRRNRNPIRVGAAFALLLTVGIVATTVLAVLARRAEQAANENAIRASDNELAADRAATDARAERDRVSRANAELRLTRYIAEMNLVQSAHAAGDLGEVRRLLDAQPVDLRGPEWHYWDRRMHGFDRECRVPCPPEIRLRSGNLHHEYALTPDGRSLVVFLSEPDTGWTVRVWDVLENREVRTFRLGPDEAIDVRDVQNSFFPKLFANPNHQSVVIDRLLGNRLKDAGFSTVRQYWRVDLATGLRDDLIRRFPGGWPVHASITDDGGHLATGDEPPDTGQRDTRFTVHRLADMVSLGQLTLHVDSRLTVCPDGKHVLAIRDRPYRPAPAPPAPVNGPIECWKLGGKEPVWKVEVSLDKTDGRFVFTPDGRAVRHMSLVDEFWELTTRDLATGKVLRSDRVVPAHDIRESRLFGRVPKPAFDPTFALSRDGRRLAFGIPTGIAVCDLGLSRPVGGEPMPGRVPQTAPLRYDLETFEGPPSHLAFLPDGRIVAAFSLATGPAGIRRPDAEGRAAVAQVFTPPQYGFGVDHATEVLAHHRDRFLLRPHRRAPAGGQPAVERLCVLDGRGQLVFDTDLGPAPPAAVGSVQNGSYAFSGDGRYLYGVDEFFGRTPRPDWAGSVVIRDLTMRKEVLRLNPPLGDRYFLPSFDDSGRQVVVCVKDREIPEYGYGNRVKAAKVFEVPSGKPVLDLDVPNDARIGAIRFDPAGFVNTVHPVGGSIERVTYRWDARGGYVGMEAGPEWPRMRSKPEEWQERGSRVIRIRSGGSGWGRQVDIWDVARRGPEVPPLVSFDVPEGTCQLSPDGTRLVVRGSSYGINVRTETKLHCTTTGRVVLVLSSEQSGRRRASRNDFGLWSPDGQQFWYGVDGDGKPVGWDFRPVPEAKK